ncbi:PD-(D/E)XK nuclease family protein [uncultured Anaerovibrio sp.]|uniref:PDDEXK-like family protein n=1 Tax=uncultured Anaerovibrio sp. TaxID=361586 RepID=UPI0025DC825C|nr:PD-(D/E)XK nuclease family protein [uncultured Anaerovibrio sp.]
MENNKGNGGDIMNKKMIDLLDEVRVLVASHRAENFRNGREFNVFYIQRIASSEVQICRFLRELLDPIGSHGQGSVFLKKFIDIVLKPENTVFNDEEYKNARVVCEETIDNSRRIDMVIHIGMCIFPIEVKVYAGDQVGQCQDYYNYAVQKDPNAKVYYLTLDGHDPSKESKGTLSSGQYQCISFGQDILKWLEVSIAAGEIEQVYPVRELLVQFRNIIRDITDNCGGKLAMEIKDKIMSSSDNIIAAIEIANVLPDIKADKMREVFYTIKQYMEKKGYSNCIEEYDEQAGCYYRDNRKKLPALAYIVAVNDENLVGKLELVFEVWDKLYFGICPHNEKKSTYAEDYVRKSLSPKDTKHSSGWYWWKYLNEKNNVDFRHCNQEYLRLFDETGFKEYMNTVFSTIDSVVDDILKLE